MTPAAKTLLTHGTLLALSAAAAGIVWLREVPPAQAVVRDVVVWKGREADVERIELIGTDATTVLEGRVDAVGRHYEGKTHRSAVPSPHGESQGGDVVFIGVTQASKTVEQLADLRALRALGQLPAERDAEFGLKDATKRLKVTMRGETRELLLGADAPGGSDRYVRDVKSGDVFAVDAEPLRSLESGDHMLAERDLHGFPFDPEVDHLEVTSGGKRRAIVRRGPTAARFFADPASSDKPDDTFTTWMTKVDRLRPAEFVSKAPELDPKSLVRIDLFASKSPLGFLELGRTPGDSGDLYLRSERTRLWAKVTKGTGDQVLSDLDSVLK